MIVYPKAKPIDNTYSSLSGIVTYVVRHARVDNSESEEITALIRVCANWAEEHCNQPLFERNLACTLDCIADGQFAMQQVNSIVNVSYQPEYGADWISLNSEDYSLTGNVLVFSNEAKSLSPVYQVKITVNAGWTTINMPPSLQHRLAMFVLQLYDNRSTLDENLLSAILRDYMIITV